MKNVHLSNDNVKILLKGIDLLVEEQNDTEDHTELITNLTSKDESVQFANVNWNASDILIKKSKWDYKQCIDFLEENEHAIQESMIREGWNLIEHLIKDKK